jgi:VCBS repeat-containing protein
VRQGEAVDGQDVLGTSESDLIFLGYPNGFLADIRAYDAPSDTELVHTETYASRGLGSTDWHNYHFGGHGQYTRSDMLADVQSVIATYRPDHIFTHSPWDRHDDHFTTYLEIIEAVDNIQGSDPSYQPLIHTTLVHVSDPVYWGQWPATESPSSPVNEYYSLESDTGSELVWDQRESFEVPGNMQGQNPPNNLKEQAVEAHASQVDADASFIRRFIHSDEIFWVERLGEPEGMPESYSLDEGASKYVPASGVLANDVRGVAAPVSQSINPNPLGPMSAELISGPSHDSAFSLNSDGSFSYTHDGSETTSDSFTYRPVQGSTDGSTTTVTITINPINDGGPTAMADNYGLDNGATLNVPATGVLGNDSDPDGDAMTAVKVADPSHGSLTLNSNGSFSYTHDGSATTSDSFTYKAYDGQEYSNTATVSLTIEEEVVTPDPLQVSVSGTTTGAVGTSYPYTAVVTGGEGAKSYAWTAKRNGTEVATSNKTTFSFSSSTSGDYTIELTVTDSSGSASDTQVVKLMGDIGSSPFVGDIIWLADEAITQGCNPPANDLYCPNDRVTRGQMAAFLVRFLGLEDIDSGISFTDIGGSVFETNILKLATAGITKGCNPPANSRFCPNDYVTRGQMAAFLVRALGLTDDGGGDLFVDDDGSVFESNIDKLATAGVTRGCNASGDEFCPNSFVTRGQMAAFLHRADGLTG